VTIAVLLLCLKAWAGIDDKNSESARKNESNEIAAEKVSTTQHVVALRDRKLSYAAVTGEMVVNMIPFCFILPTIFLICFFSRHMPLRPGITAFCRTPLNKRNWKSCWLKSKISA
jgi:hypothetical protein